ncbi:MAG: hypothetical protein ABR922_20360 [Streptosporangiaceae bacterium]
MTEPQRVLPAGFRPGGGRPAGLVPDQEAAHEEHDRRSGDRGGDPDEEPAHRAGTRRTRPGPGPGTGARPGR